MFFEEINNTWTLFLDRDGVINKRIIDGYVLNKDQFEFIEGVFEALVFLKPLFFKIIIVTNQQCIGKKLINERNLFEIHRYMCDEIEKMGGKIDNCYFAPEVKNVFPNTRKPNPDMAIQAKKDFPSIDFNKSIMIGDTDTDILFGKKLGMKTVRILEIDPIGIEADLTVKNLIEFVNLWKKNQSYL
ncbi:MAG: HAD-IIIA family hydrolase [Flavobacteriia bacterium]|nr:HAD-IIIA family hydrolase [Flavobacteriia bacterium]